MTVTPPSAPPAPTLSTEITTQSGERGHNIQLHVTCGNTIDDDNIATCPASGYTVMMTRLQCKQLEQQYIGGLSPGRIFLDHDDDEKRKQRLMIHARRQKLSCCF